MIGVIVDARDQDGGMEDRERLRAELRQKYANGASIRELAREIGRSYGYVRQLLSEAGVNFRTGEASGGKREKRTARLGLRSTQEQVDLIWEAAMLEGKTASAFVIEVATSHARDVVAEHRDLVLSREAFQRFYAELDAPAEVVPELVELFRNQRSAADSDA